MSESGAPLLPPLVVPAEGEVPGDTFEVRSGPEVHTGVLLLLPLLGVWRGRGKGDFGAGDVDFAQEMRFGHDGRGLLTYESVAWPSEPSGSSGPSDPSVPSGSSGPDASGGAPDTLAHPLVRERGFWRPRPQDGPDGFEAVIAHDDGTVEVTIGRAVATRFELRSDVVVRTAGEGLRVHRLFGLVDGDLLYAWDRSVPDTPMRPYMSARLRRVSRTL